MVCSSLIENVSYVLCSDFSFEREHCLTARKKSFCSQFQSSLLPLFREASPQQDICGIQNRLQISKKVRLSAKAVSQHAINISESRPDLLFCPYLVRRRLNKMSVNSKSALRFINNYPAENVMECPSGRTSTEKHPGILLIREVKRSSVYD